MDDALSSYDYELPAELIAGQPLARRDDSRLMVLDRAAQQIAHRRIRDLPALLRAGDCLVLNDTQVVPARLLGKRTATGGKWEGLYLGRTDAGLWKLIGQTRGRLHAGEQISILPPHRPPEETLTLTLLERDDGGVWTAQPDSPGDALTLLQRFGTVPLPPYLHRELATETDWSRYQTTFARRPGAIAAPTAGLHFTPEILSQCEQHGIGHVYVTLHVGIGTFRPINVENLAEHQMHAEWCELSPETAERLNATRTAGGRIVAVGTTSVRTLESSAGEDGVVRPHRGDTRLFIRPPYRFRAVDALLTNFHLPRSTLLVLVSALAGRDFIQQAYAAAVKERYRFYSYGDAMLIL